MTPVTRALGTASGVIYTCTLSGDKGIDFRPALTNHIIRGFAVTVLGSGPVFTTGVALANLMIQSTASGSTASQVVSIRATATENEGDVIFSATLDQLVRPGERVFVNVPAIVTGSGDFSATIYVEVSPSEPGNALTSQVRATTATA